jgi:hypothetical protein
MNRQGEQEKKTVENMKVLVKGDQHGKKTSG